MPLKFIITVAFSLGSYNLQRNDIAMAITKYDQFDFLIDIVPRDSIDKTGESFCKFLFEPGLNIVTQS